ncbi:MAG: putative DNA-binding domain-containing protein [Planctomycetota bacterium]
MSEACDPTPRDPMPNLDQTERWMLAVITHREGVAAGLLTREAQQELTIDATNLERLVLPSRNLGSAGRLQIYSNMYFWRIVDIMADEYPTVRHVVGPEQFYELAVAYIVKHPSRHYDLARMSVEFPRFLALEAESCTHREFVTELATLERAMEDVFDAPTHSALSLADLLRIPAESWSAARFEPAPGLQLLEFDYPVSAFLRCVREGTAEGVPVPSRSWVAVFRAQDFTVWRSDLSREQFVILRQLASRQTLGDAVAACAEIPDIEFDALIPQLEAWFREWTADGLFARVSVPE